MLSHVYIFSQIREVLFSKVISYSVFFGGGKTLKE